MRTPPRLNANLETLSQLPLKNAYNEEVKKVEIPNGVDPRPVMIQPLEKVLIPRFNELYDTLRTKQGWRYMGDAYADGVATLTPNTVKDVKITLTSPPNWRLNEWPGAVQVYLIVRYVGIVPYIVPTANAGMRLKFIDKFGNVTPLLHVTSQTGGNYTTDVILPTPITDPSNAEIGTLSIELADVASSGGDFWWAMGFSSAYMLPARYGYEILDQEEYQGKQWTRGKKEHKGNEAD